MRAKLAKVAEGVKPFLEEQNLENLTDQILREDEKIRQKVIQNPSSYRELLKSSLEEVYKKYKGPVYWGKIIDKWDRITSAVGIAAEFIPGAGQVASAVEEVAECIPKAAYAAYYVKKTKDWKALPYWLAYETASFLPLGIGDVIDFKNIYFERAKKKMKEAAKKLFKEKAGIKT